MTVEGKPPVRRRRSPTTSAIERELLSEVLELKDELRNLSVAIERLANTNAQNQMLATRDIGSLYDRIKVLEEWQDTVERERSEARGAARARAGMFAAVAALAGGVASAIVAIVNRLFS